MSLKLCFGWYVDQGHGRFDVVSLDFTAIFTLPVLSRSYYTSDSVRHRNKIFGRVLWGSIAKHSIPRAYAKIETSRELKTAKEQGRYSCE